MKIYIAPGHGITRSGTSDPGAISGHEVEHTLARAVVTAYANGLRRCGFVVVEETEPDPDYIGSVARANAAGVNCGDEVHFNAGGGHGVEILCHPNTSSANRSCATRMGQYISQATGLPLRGTVLRSDLYWLNATRFPALLPEIAFVDGDSSYIDQPNFALKVGEALTRARCEFAVIPYKEPGSVSPPSGAPPWPFGPYGYLGTARPDPLCHSGYYSAIDRSAVSVWQNRMNTRGWAIRRDGYYDNACATVCTQFQREKGLKVSGLVDKITWVTAWTAPIT